jgi:ATP-dependent Lhr-like helicase
MQPWHGDVSRGRDKFWREPADILITTPESLEAMLMRRSKDLSRLAGDLRYMVVDELHCFFGSERGAQLQSLLRRVEALAGFEIPRVALSATLGDPSGAGDFLRPSRTRPVTIIQPEHGGGELRLVVKAVIEPDVPDTHGTRKRAAPAAAVLDDVTALPLPPDAVAPRGATAAAEPSLPDVRVTGGLAAVAEHLFERLRGDTHLVFANARAKVELLASYLADLCEAKSLPNEFFPHHGSLAKELRLDVEARLRDGQLPTTAIATSTLEMGIDLGDIASIGQVGPAPSVASLKQRVGRSGRRAGSVQTLRQYILLRTLSNRSNALDYLRLTLVQAIAHVELMKEGRYEPPEKGELHLSSLVQQILSIIYASGGGATAKTLWATLGGRGAFSEVDLPTFAATLRAMGQSKLLEQTADGTFVPGDIGEKVAEHYSFFASFMTPEEFQLIAKGRTIGTLPIDSPVIPGQFLLFGGRRWRVVEVRVDEKAILLDPAAGGEPPDFDGNPPLGHRIVHQRMREILADDARTAYAYLDPAASGALALARDAFRGYRLAESPVLLVGNEIYVAHWSGSRIGQTLSLWLQRAGLDVENDGPFLRVSSDSAEHAWQVIRDTAAAPAACPEELTALVPVVAEQKFEPFLQSDRALLERGWAARWLDIDGAREQLVRIAAASSPAPPASTLTA